MRSGPQTRFIASCDAIIRSTVLLRLCGQLEIEPSGDLSQSNARTRAPISPPPTGHGEGPEGTSLSTARSRTRQNSSLISRSDYLSNQAQEGAVALDNHG